MRFPSLLLGAFVVAGCSSAASQASPPPAPSPTPGTVGASDLPATACPAGTRPRVGQTTCEPVGPKSCPAGFQRSSSGWGCHAVVPANPCTGSTRAALGQSSCVPIDDCTAAFPPPEASVVVTPSAKAGTTPPEVTTIAAALAMAPVGGTIAVDAGNYDESINLTQSVHLVGRCASKVVVQAIGLRAVYAYGYFPAELRSMTIDGAQGGLVASGANLTVTNVVLVNNQLAALAGYGGSVALTTSVLDAGAAGSTASSGVSATTVQSGSTITLDQVDVRGFASAFTTYDPKSVVSVKKSVVSYVGPEQKAPLAGVWAGSLLKVEDSLLWVREGGLLTVGASLPDVDMGPPATIEVTGSELLQTDFNRQDILTSVGSGAKLSLSESTLHHQSLFGVSVGGPGSSVSVQGSVIEADSTFDVVREAVFVGTGGAATLDDSAVVNAIQAALIVGDQGSQMTLTRSLVTGTKFVGPGPEAKNRGSGIAVGVGEAGRLTVKDTSLVGNQQFGLYVGAPSTAEVSDLLVDQMKAAPQQGSSITVENGGLLSLTGGIVRGSPESGLACLSGGVVVGKSRFVDNQVALAIDSSLLVEQAAAPAPTPAGKVVLWGTEFEGNTTKIGPPPSYFPGI